MCRLIFNRAKEGEREGYMYNIYRESKRKIGEERSIWRVRERDQHNLEGEASTDHPIGEGLG